MSKGDLKTLKGKTLVSSIDMNKRNLKKLTKAQLIRLLLKQQAQKPSNSVTSQFQVLGPKLENPFLNHARVSNKWLMSTKT